MILDSLLHDLYIKLQNSENYFFAFFLASFSLTLNFTILLINPKGIGLSN